MKINEIYENISHTSKRLHDIEKEKGVKPGTPEWFKLWFSLPYLKESITEAFDNPYPYTWDSTHDRYAEFGNDSFLAKAEMDMGELLVMFTLGKPGVSWTIDFAVDGSMDKTGDGDQFRIFATVVAVIKDWMANKVDLSKVTQIDFSSDKDGAAEDSRSKLYKRFGQQLASKLGWNLEVTDRGQFASFKIKNPDAPIEEEVEVSLHGDAKKGYVLSKIEVSGDERNAGQGTKAMQDIVDRMDREGAIIALTPDDAFGGNKNRLIKFYKRFGFVPNKGRNKDFRFRETMIRYPQSNVEENFADRQMGMIQKQNTYLEKMWKEDIFEKYGKTLDEFYKIRNALNGKVVKIDGEEVELEFEMDTVAGFVEVWDNNSGKDVNPFTLKFMEINENFADGKVKGKSRPGRVKRAGASCNGSVTELRAKAKKASGEKAKMYHWCANMKAGKKK